MTQAAHRANCIPCGNFARRYQVDLTDPETSPCPRDTFRKPVHPARVRRCKPADYVCPNRLLGKAVAR
jgi:hypothetical protein